MHRQHKKWASLQGAVAVKPLLTKCVHAARSSPRRSCWPAQHTPVLLVDVVIESVTKLLYICGTGMMVCVVLVVGGGAGDNKVEITFNKSKFTVHPFVVNLHITCHTRWLLSLAVY